MGKDAPDPPAPIDPRITAQAQTDSNAATARLQQQLGMTGTYGPGGSVTYRSDPNAPSGYSQYTDLSPEQRAIYDAQTAAQAGALGVANNQIGRIDTALGRTLTSPDLIEGYDGGRPISYNFNTGGDLARSFDTGGNVRGSYDTGDPLRRGFDTGGPLQTDVDSGGNYSRTFNPGQGVEYDVGPTDFEAARNATIDSEFERSLSRLNPQLDRARSREETRLANMGFSGNSTGYKDRMDDLGRTENDARDLALSSAIRAGHDQQRSMFDQAVTQGQFRNAAAGQDYAQNLGLAGFENDVVDSEFGRNMQRAGFGNQARGQQFAQGQSAAGFENTSILSDVDRAREAAGFENSAVGQRYAQNLGLAGFGNDATLSDFERNMATAGFGNAASGQEEAQNAGRVSFTNAARQARFGNDAFSRSQPINDFALLMGSGGQAAMPAAYSGPTAGVAPTDVLGAHALKAQQEMQAYNARVANVNSRNMGLSNIFAAALGG